MDKRILKKMLFPVLVLLAFIGTITIVYYVWISSLKQNYQGIPVRRETAETNSPEEGSEPVGLSLEIPSEIYGTDNLIFTIGYENNRNTSGLISKSYYPGSANVNAAVFKADGKEPVLVFDKPVKIENIDYPDSQSDSAKNFILYNCIPNDNDSSGSLDHNDNKVLFLSDLNGENLVQITPDTLNAAGHKYMSKFNALFISLEDKQYFNDNSGKSITGKQKFLLWFDLNERRLINMDKLDSIVKRAERILFDNL